jgi:virulence-associated protein VapD
MLDVVFDLIVDKANALHPSGQRAAYSDIGAVLRRHGFKRLQGSVYVSEHTDLCKLAMAMSELQSQSWMGGSVRDIRAFRIGEWSDFLPFMQEPAL